MKVLKLIRYQNLLIVIISQFLVFQFLATNNCFIFKFDRGLTLLIFATVLIAAAGYMINDILDVKMDLVNKPESVQVGRKFRREYILSINIALNLIALAIGVLLKWQLLLIFVIVIAAMYLYSFVFKKILLIGNFVVSVILALTLAIVWIYNQGEPNALIIFYTFFAFATGFIREVVKDIEDIEGDRQEGCVTFPIAFGISRTWIFVLLMLSVLTISVIAFTIYLAMNNYILSSVYIFVFVVGYSMFLLIKTKRTRTKEDYSELSRAMKLLMLVGILSMIFLCL